MSYIMVSIKIALYFLLNNVEHVSTAIPIIVSFVGDMLSIASLRAYRTCYHRLGHLNCALSYTTSETVLKSRDSKSHRNEYNLINLVCVVLQVVSCTCYGFLH